MAMATGSVASTFRPWAALAAVITWCSACTARAIARRLAGSSSTTRIVWAAIRAGEHRRRDLRTPLRRLQSEPLRLVASAPQPEGRQQVRALLSVDGSSRGRYRAGSNNGQAANHPAPCLRVRAYGAQPVPFPIRHARALWRSSGGTGLVGADRQPACGGDVGAVPPPGGDASASGRRDGGGRVLLREALCGPDPAHS